MAECLYRIKTEDGRELTFDSDQELDSFLAVEYQNYTIDKVDATLHSDSIQNTLDKIEKLTKSITNIAEEVIVYNEDGDAEVGLKIPNSIGTTRFITNYGDPNDFTSPLITGFNLKQYLETQRIRLVNEGLSKLEIDEKLNNLQKSWKQLTDYGTEIHKLFESVINQTEYNPKGLSEKQTDGLREMFEDWIDSLKEKHGNNAKFLVEVPVVSNNIHEVYKNAGIESINGRIDLLVVDEKGTAHIYDFKVSKKSVGSWAEMRNNLTNNFWHSTKKLTAQYQQYFYKAILAQYGINVASTNIVPIKIDPVYNSDELIESLDGAYIDTRYIKTLPQDGNQYTKVTQILPVKTLLDNIDLTKAIQEPMTKIVPNYELTTQVQRGEATVERYRNKPGIVHYLENDPKGKYYIYNEYKKNPYVYCNSEEELTKALEELIESENKHRGREISDLGDLVENTMNGSVDILDWDLGNNRKTDYCRTIFKKYILPKDATQSERDKGWKLQKNPQFIAAGVFVFTKDGFAEIVSLHHNLSHEIVNLGLGTNILGATHKNRDIDENLILQATNGNIDLIKIMCLLNSSTEALKGYKILGLKSFNIWLQDGTDCYNETLLDNFSRLCQIHNIPLNLTNANFASTLQSTVQTIEDICGEELFNKIGDWSITIDPDNIIQGVPFILRKMEELKKLSEADGLRSAIYNGVFDFNDPLQTSYVLLGRALNKLNGYDIYIETDPAKWVSLSKERVYTGTYVNSAANSPSLNIRSLAKIYSVAETQIRRKELKYDSRIRKNFLAFYQYNQRNRFAGGEVKFFDNLFRKNKDGKIDDTFCLKDPNDPNLAKEEKDVINLLLDIFNYFKYHGNEAQIEANRGKDEWYQVPIMLGSTYTLFHNNSFGDAAKAKWNESLNFLRLIPEQETDLMQAKRQKKVYNRFNISQTSRNQLIQNHGVQSFETQLEEVLRTFINSYITEEVMEEYLPRMQGIKFALQYQQQMFGNLTNDTIEFIDKFVDINAYGQPIMDPKLRPLYKCLATVKNITTATTLGFNWRSGLREMMQGMWVHISRTMANAYGKDQFTQKDIAKAWTIICKDSTKDINLCTLCDALNVDYGMANADPHQVRERLSQSKSGWKNFNSDTLYVFNRVPDTFHRLGLLVAKMIHEGCWEAHSIVNDELVYDFKKDKRFTLINDPNVDKNSVEYKKQYSLYKAMLDQFNKEGWTLQDGDALPRAYTIQEGTSIKSFAELCFGHYDRSSQMLMKHMFMGALWLQFRTFLSAKLEQWILKPGTYNQGQFKQITDENGINLVRIYEFDENGMPSFRIDLETNLKEGDKWEYHTEWQGRFMEGIAYSMFDFGKALMKMDINELKNLWKNDTKRANFVLFCTDMIWMTIMMWIIAALFFGDKEEQNPLAHGLTSAMYNSFADGPILNIIASLGEDLNPPSYSVIKNLWRQTGAVLSGNKNLFDATVNSFGALNDLKYLAKQIE